MRCIVLALILVPATAQALSCLAPNPAREVDQAFRSGGEPSLMIGRRTTHFDNDNGSYRFEGRVLAQNITIDKLSASVDVAASCVASWCGELPREPVEGLFVSIHPAGGFKLTFGPCGGTSYEAPTEEQLRALQRCIEAGRCSAEDVSTFEGP